MGVVDEHSKFICRVPIRVGLLLHPGLQSAFKMTRGNQRELARAKNVKKQSDAKKGSSQKDGNKGMTLEARKQRDAEMMRLKQEKGKAKEKPSN